MVDNKFRPQVTMITEQFVTTWIPLSVRCRLQAVLKKGKRIFHSTMGVKEDVSNYIISQTHSSLYTN